MTDPLGQSQVLPYLRELTKEGLEFHLVSFEKSDRYKKHYRVIREICNDAGIHWHPQDYSNEGGLRKTIRQIQKMHKVAKYLNDRHHFDVVHCRSYIAAMAGLRMKRKFGTKFIFDMRGFWADERVDGGLWDLSNPLYKRIYNYFKRKEKEFFKEADHVISLTTRGMDEIHSWKGFANTEITVIPCCADLGLFSSDEVSNEKKLQLRNSLGFSEDVFVLGYVGSIGTWYMLDEMLDFFKVLKQQKPNAKFLFVTGEDPESIYKVANQKGLSKEDFVITSCLHKEVPTHISIFDLSVFFIRPTFSKKASSPTKQGEIMAMGIPLVCNSGVGDTDSIVEKYHAGVVINEFTESEFEGAIKEYNKFDQSKTILGANEFFSLEEGVKNYLSVYHKLDEK